MKLVIDLMKDITNKKPPKYSIWLGEEVAVQKVYQKAIENLGYNIVVCDTVQQALSRISKRGFDNSTKLFVVINDNDYLKADTKWEKVINAVKSTRHLLLLKYPALDKRSKMYKQQADYITEFEKMTEEVLFKHTQKQLNEMSDTNLELLIKICESDYNRILLESDKIKQYAKSSQNDLNTSFTTLLKENVIYQPIRDITFKLTDSIVYGDVKATSKYLTQSKQKEEPAIMILSILYNQFKAMLMVQGLGHDKSNAAAKTGLTSWQVKQALDKIGGYSIKELRRALDVIRKTEIGIKTGKIEQDIALEYAVLNIMK